MRLSRERTFPPRCPFCDREIDRPKEIEDEEWHEFEGGRCECGAVYAFDPTARNGGAVMLQAMVDACYGDWDWAISISRGEDYLEERIRKYDGLTHRVGASEAFGTLYFIRLIPRA
jgi:hypothetical protein